MPRPFVFAALLLPTLFCSTALAQDVASRWGSTGIDGRYALAADAGFGRVQLTAHWCDIDSPDVPGEYDFSALDTEVQAAADAQLEVLLILSPSGASALCPLTRLPDGISPRLRSEDRVHPPNDAAQWTAFVQAVAEHYDGTSAPRVDDFATVSGFELADHFGGSAAEYFDEYLPATKAGLDAVDGRTLSLTLGAPTDRVGLAIELIRRRDARFSQDPDGVLRYANRLFRSFAAYVTHPDPNVYVPTGPIFGTYEGLSRWALSEAGDDDRPEDGLPGLRSRAFIERWLAGGHAVDRIGVSLTLGDPGAEGSEDFWELVEEAADDTPVRVLRASYHDADRAADPPQDPSGVEADSAVAEGLFKTAALALAHDADQLYLAPLVDAGDAAVFPGLYTAPQQPRAALEVLRRLTTRIGPGQMELWRTDISPPRVFIYFRDPETGARLAAVWIDDPELSDAAVAISPGAAVEVIDLSGAEVPFELFGNQVNLRLGSAPVLLSWNGPPVAPTPTPSPTVAPSPSPSPPQPSAPPEPTQMVFEPKRPGGGGGCRSTPAAPAMLSLLALCLILFRRR